MVIVACLLILSGCGGSSTSASIERCIKDYAKTRTKPNHFAAAFEASSKTTAVSWEGPVYPALPKNELNYVGSGVASYSYRYRLGNSPWSGWHKTKSPDDPRFTIASTKDGARIAVEVATTDDADHTHHPVHAFLTASEPKVTIAEAVTDREGEDCGEAPLYP
jgi:hypothetical protein